MKAYLFSLLVVTSGIFGITLKGEEKVYFENDKGEKAALIKTEKPDHAVMMINEKVMPLIESRRIESSAPVSRVTRERFRYVLHEIASEQPKFRDFNIYKLKPRGLIEDTQAYLYLRYNEETKVVLAKNGEKWVSYEEHPFLKLLIKTAKK